MRTVEFLDTSLRDGEQTPGVNFSIKEKIAIARQLEKWGISAIEAGFPAASPDSFTAVQEIAKVLKKTAVTGLARSVKSDIDACYEALKDAKYPQVHVFIATSPIHRKYKLNKSKEEILEAIKEHVSYARSKFEIVEFSPEDATRTELDFLLQVVQTAVDAGASYINIPDTVGFITPEEYGNIFKYLIDNVKTERQIVYSPHCHDDLGMAVANSLAAVKNGAGRVEGTINGIGGPSTSICVEELAQLGVRTFLRIGTTGAIQPHINVGDILVTTGAVRLDGASRHFAPIEYPAVANFECTTALYNAAKEKGIEPFVGITASSDTFYPGQERYDTYSGKVYRDYQGLLKQWQDLNVMNYEMESATLFTMCNALGLRAGMVAGVIVNRTQQEIPNEATMKDTEDKAVSVVVEAARKLLA